MILKLAAFGLVLMMALALISASLNIADFLHRVFSALPR